jgi:hypothetical protein
VSGAQGRNRTTDTCIFSAVLYRLSYLGFLLGLLLSTGLLVRRAVIESEPAAVQNGKCANRAAVMRERDSSLRRLVDLVAPLVFWSSTNLSVSITAVSKRGESLDQPYN